MFEQAEIMQRQIQWLGHAERIGESSGPKKVSFQLPEKIRRAGPLRER